MIAAGTVLSGRYRIEREIGAGGMGAVYEATDLRTGGTVAVKALHQHFARDAAFVARLRREAQIAAAIRSPRAVKVTDLGEDQDIHYLVMEHVTGENLSDLLERQRRLSLDQALWIGIEIARVLESANAVNVVHRDLKPGNIRITDEGEVKVLDFGIARVENQPGITSTNIFTGTPEYCAPERMDGLGDIRADIYSLGVMLYEMVSGRRPFTGVTAFAILRQHELAEVPPLPADIPPPVAELVRRCLAKRPNDRYQTPTELLNALRALRGGAAGALVAPAVPTPLPSTVMQPRPAAAPPVSEPPLSATVMQPRPATAPPAAPAPTTTPPEVPAFVPPSVPPLAPAYGGAVRTVERPQGMSGPTPFPGEAPAGRGRTPVIAVVVAAVVLLAAAGGAFALLGRNGGSGATPDPTASAQAQIVTASATTTPAATASRTASPSPAPLPALLQPGEKRTLNYAASSRVSGMCSAGEIVLSLHVSSIERDQRQPDRAIVTYVRSAPAQPGLSCVVPYLPDGPTGIILRSTRRIPGGDFVREQENGGGTGLTKDGASDLYGKDLAGTLVFDGIDWQVDELALVQFLSGRDLHKIVLLSSR